MPMMPDATSLRVEVERAVIEAVGRVGAGAVVKADIVNPFLGRGVHRATLFRWVDAVMASGKPDAHVAKIVRKAAADRAADPIKADAKLAEKLPATVTIDHVATEGAIPVIDRLNMCLRAADQVMAHARTDEGKVRNSKLLLSASEHLRRCLETAARITEVMVRADKIEQFNRAIIEEIAKESPPVAERLALRLSQIASQWGG